VSQKGGGRSRPPPLSFTAPVEANNGFDVLLYVNLSEANNLVLGRSRNFNAETAEQMVSLSDAQTPELDFSLCSAVHKKEHIEVDTYDMR
jgi:hypothetical protein